MHCNGTYLFDVISAHRLLICLRQACGPGKHSRYAAEYRAELGNLMFCFPVFQLLRECMNQGSPVHPWPQVAAELGNLEETREKKESANMASLQLGFNQASRVAQKRIGETLGAFLKMFDDPESLRSMSFGRHGSHTHLTFGLDVLRCLRRATTNSTALRQLPQDTLGSKLLSVKVNVLPVSPPDPSLRNKIDSLERSRSDAEKGMFEAVRGMKRHHVCRALLLFLSRQLKK